MEPSNIAAIHWEAMWSRQTELSTPKWEGIDAICERAVLPPVGTETSTYADELINRLDLHWTHSVLDIGCGNGSIAIAIARRVQTVTALDSDPRMLASITYRARAEGITNLRFVHARWETVEIGKDIEPHDVVLASRFFPITDLRAFLERMNRAARELCYLTWIAQEKSDDAAIARILGIEYHPLPEYGIIYNLLYAMGWHPRVETFESRTIQTFGNIEEAVHDLTRGYGKAVETSGKKAEIESWVKSQLSPQDGRLQREISTRWALIGWRKRNV